MSSRYSVQVHQKEPSIDSYYSYSSNNYSSGSSTPRSYSSSYSDELREYGASKSTRDSTVKSTPLTPSQAKHTSTVVRSGRNVVVNHGKVTYDPNATSPGYGGSYTRHS